MNRLHNQNYFNAALVVQVPVLLALAPPRNALVTRQLNQHPSQRILANTSKTRTYFSDPQSVDECDGMFVFSLIGVWSLPLHRQFKLSDPTKV
jgi:hypothetical protein